MTGRWITAFLAVLSSSVFSVEPLQICQFKDDKDAALSLTFDDGTRDHLLYALPRLERYGFKGTFYITIRRIAERTNEPSSPGSNRGKSHRKYPHKKE